MHKCYRRFKHKTDSTLSYHTWDLVPFPDRKSTIGCSWVYLKFQPNGTVARLKARLVAEVYSQKYGVDYASIFSAVSQVGSVHVIIFIQLTLIVSPTILSSVVILPLAKLTLVVYVDDTVLTQTDSAGINQLKHFSQKKFQTMDLGSLHYFLDIEVLRTKSHITLSLRKYVWIFQKRLDCWLFGQWKLLWITM